MEIKTLLIFIGIGITIIWLYYKFVPHNLKVFIGWVVVVGLIFTLVIRIVVKGGVYLQ